MIRSFTYLIGPLFDHSPTFFSSKASPPHQELQEPFLHLEDSLGHHGLRQVVELPGDPLPEVLKVSREGLVHQLLQVAPQKEITGVHVWGGGRAVVPHLCL